MVTNVRKCFVKIRSETLRVLFVQGLLELLATKSCY